MAKLTDVLSCSAVSVTYPETTTTSTIEVRASSLLREAGVDGQLPVPLEHIAKFLGFEPIGFIPVPNADPKADTTKVSGMIDYKNKKIFVNTDESNVRQRFTLAHEIGHAVLHSGEDDAIVDLRASIDNPSSQKEIEANRFAAALLMPRDQFVRLWFQVKGDINTLCTSFGASRQAVEIRIANTVNAKA